MKKFIIALIIITLTPFLFAKSLSDCREIKNNEKRLICYDSLTIKEENISEQQLAESLGREHLRIQSSNIIRSSLVNDFNGWTGKTIFKLKNGQVWRQVSNNTRNYKPRKHIVNAKVTIKKGFFGSYDLEIDGVKRIIQVKRIK